MRAFPIIGWGVRAMLVTVRAILCVLVVVAAGILVMPECHALARHDGSHALDRHGHEQQRDGKDPQ